MRNFFSNIKYDFPASIIVALIAMPLCLGVALAAGAPLFSGIIGGIVGGVVVTLISKSSLGVSGPAAGLTAIVASALITLGSFEALLLAVFIAGIIQVILGLLNAGVIADYFPSSVIKGMLAGIGLIIIIKQIPFALGMETNLDEIWNSYNYGSHNGTDLLSHLHQHLNLGACIITAISIAILVAWDSKFMSKFSFTKLIKAPLVVVALGIAFQALFSNKGALQLDTTHLVNLPIPHSAKEFFGQFTTPDFSFWTNKDIYSIAFVLAIVASLESLLSAEATDQLDPQKRVTPTSRELIAQGVGNMVAGLIGGFPITQVVVRSSANIQSGGRTRASAFFHGIILLLCAVFIPHILNLIPLSSLAAILIVVGAKLAKPALFKAMYKVGKWQFLSFIITVVGILLTNLLVGICLGLAVSIINILRHNMKMPYQFKKQSSPEGDKQIFHFTLAEQSSFLNKAGIKEMLNNIPANSEVTLDASKTKQMHPDINEIINDFIDHAPSINIKIKYLAPSEEYTHRGIFQPEKLAG